MIQKWSEHIDFTWAGKSATFLQQLSSLFFDYLPHCTKGLRTFVSFNESEERKRDLMFQSFKDLLAIYRWKELWMIVSVPAVLMGIWLLFCFLLTIPITIIRAIAIWSLISILTLGSATVDALRKQRGKK